MIAYPKGAPTSDTARVLLLLVMLESIPHAGQGACSDNVRALASRIIAGTYAD